MLPHPPPSKLSKQDVDSYWKQVRKLLRDIHGLDAIGARRAVETYWETISRDPVSDVIYHVPVEEAAEGIVRGGYATARVRSSSKSVFRRAE